MRRIALGLLGIPFLIAGCAGSAVSQFYHPGLNPPPVTSSSVEPELRQGSGDGNKDLYAAAAEGWGVIGYSSFYGPQPPRRALVAKAKEVGAALVIEEVRYGDTQNTGAVGTTAFTRYGAITVAAPTSVDRYHQVYVFLAKSPHIGLGVAFVPVSPEEHAKLGTNKGMLVVAVVAGSPAFQADVLAGDVVLTVSDVPVYNKDSLYHAVEARYGQRADLLIRRSGETIHKLVSIPPGGAW